MQKIILKDLPRYLQNLQDDNSVGIYYADECEDYFIICDSDSTKRFCESMGILQNYVEYLTKLPNKFANIFVLAGAIYSTDQLTKLSITSYKQVNQ